MGATVITGKSAGAFTLADGTIIYVLFEKTHEKNNYPASPHWCCIAVGTYEEVMRRIFLGAASCEGGMLQNSHGHIKPENFIRAWERQLAAPAAFVGETIPLSIRDSMYAPIPVEKEDKVRAALEQLGRSDLYERIKKGGTSISLRDDYPVVRALYGAGRVIGTPWRVFNQHDLRGLPKPELGFKRTSIPIRAPNVQAFVVNGEELLVKVDSGPWQQPGWMYSAVGAFIAEVVLPLELEHTGCGFEIIRSFRSICANASPAPAATRVTVTRSPEGLPSGYHCTVADDLARALGIVEKGQLAPACFRTTIAEARKVDALHFLTQLAVVQAHWDIPDPTRVKPTLPDPTWVPSCINTATGVQGDLFLVV